MCTNGATAATTTSAMTTHAHHCRRITCTSPLVTVWHVTVAVVDRGAHTGSPSMPNATPYPPQGRYGARRHLGQRITRAFTPELLGRRIPRAFTPILLALTLTPFFSTGAAA